MKKLMLWIVPLLLAVAVVLAQIRPGDSGGVNGGFGVFTGPAYSSFYGQNGVSVSTNPGAGTVTAEIMSSGFSMTNTAPNIQMHSFGTASAASINLYSYNGDITNMTNVAAGDLLSRIDTWGVDDSAGTHRAAMLEVRANGDFSGGSSPGLVSILVGKATSGISQERAFSLSAYNITNNADVHFRSNVLWQGISLLDSQKAMVQTPGTLASPARLVLTNGTWIIDEEFDGDTTTRSIGRHPWLAGSGNGGSIALCTNFTGAISVKELVNTNASTSDRSGMTLNANINGMTNAEYWFRARVAVGTLDYAGNTNMFRIGLGDSTTTEAPNGIYFKCQSNVWYGVCSRNGTRSVGIINSNVVSDAWVEIAYHLDRTGTNVDFYMGGSDGNLVWQTNVTQRVPNIPGILLAGQVMAHKYVGDTDRMTNYVDYFKLWGRRL